MLGEGEATVSENCDFAYGELRSTKDGALLRNVKNAPTSIYTDDGLSFFTWPREVSAVRAPMVADTHNRLYYTDQGFVRVADRLSTSLDGGEPASSYKVGVPRPSSAPTLKIASEIDLSTVDLSWSFHYEIAGLKYQERAFVPDLLDGKYQYTIPEIHTGVAKTPGIPATAITRRYQYNTGGPGGTVWTTQDIPLPSGTKITVLSSTALSYKDADGSVKTISDAISFLDENRQSHNVESVFAVSKYALTKDLSAVTSTLTPVGAVPVFRLTAKDKVTGETVFDIYSSASALCNPSSFWQLLATVSDSNPSLFFLALNQGTQEKDKETRAYVYCYANTYGEMGPPSDPAIVTTSTTGAVDVGVTRDDVSGFATISEIRIFRTPTGSTIAEYFYVGTVPVLAEPGNTFTFKDNVKAESLNEELSSEFSYPPPAGLSGLMSLPNGILCAFKDNELWFSEAYKPWAWPPAYVKPLEARIVGGIAHGSGAVITTVKTPYLVSGVSPDSMTAMRLNVDQAGVSSRAIAVVDGVVMYASHDGIVAIQGASGSLIPSQKFFTREVWRERYATGLPSMSFAVWDGRLVAYSTNGAFVPFMIRFDEADGQMTELPSLVAQCHFVSQLSDQCYYASGPGVYQLCGGANQQAVWMSGENVLNRPLNFGAASAVVEGEFVVELWAHNGTEHIKRHEQTVRSGVTTFRLPGGYLSDRYKIKISGRGRFRELRVSETGKGLAAL